MRRYLKEEAEATDYEDARSGDIVCARDLYRPASVARLPPNWRSTGSGEAAAGAVCGGQQGDGRPGQTTQGKGRCPSPSGTRRRFRFPAIAPRPGGHLQRAQRQGVRGTGGGDLPCGERHPVDHSCRGDPIQREHRRDVPLVDGLAERKVRPDELFADTPYGSGRNAFEASRRGKPGGGVGAGELPRRRGRRTAAAGADFQIVTGEQATVCKEYELEDAPERVEVFARATCEPCPLLPLPG